MKCHGNLNSGKMSHLQGQTLFLEDIAVDTFVHSSFGTVVMTLFQGFFSTPSWRTFTYLACGWAFASDRHTITTYLWLTGASAVKHFSRFYVFLGCPLYNKRWHLWGAVIRLAAQFVPEGEVIRVSFDDTTKKKAGTHIEGLARYRNGAGSARQEYRTLRGLNFVLGIMRIPLQRWPGHSLSVPVGLELYLKPAQATALNMPYRSRRQLARDILDCIAEQLPGRPIRSLADGGYATKDYVRQLPTTVHVVGRCPIGAKLYQLPSQPIQKRRGAPRKKGDLIGSPKTLAQTSKGWAPHPREGGAEIQAWCGLWHAVLPGGLIQIVVVRRDVHRSTTRIGQRKPPPPIEAFFTTDLSLSAEDILTEYRGRWAVEIEIRDANAFDGLGQDQCRKRQRVIGANTFRLVMAAARTLWFIAQVDRGTEIPLCRYRPWYRQKMAPSQLDVAEACREALHEAGIFPIPRFIPDLAENQEEPENVLPLAA
jgi:DDE superfamily endonuclease/Archaeal putative transposase ISC1217